MNKKGFAATGILYTILVLFILLFSGMLTMLYSRNNILIKIQNQVKVNVEDSAITYDVYQNGTPVYFNPETGNLCDESDAVSTTGTKTGCMKWYIFNDSITNSYVTMILDHNTTAKVSWNSEGTNTIMKEVSTTLSNDTSTWKEGLNARLITANEVAMISKHPTFNVSITTDWFFLDTNNQTQISASQGTSDYSWLFDYTYLCTSYGCNIADSSTYGYWTSTPVANSTSNVWYVNRGGNLMHDDVISSNHGIRPVIIIDKSILEQSKYVITNMISDGSFENDGNGWYFGTASSSVYEGEVVTNQFVTGNKSLYVFDDSKTIRNWSTITLSLQQNHKYYFSSFVKYESGTDNGYIGFTYNGTGRGNSINIQPTLITWSKMSKVITMSDENTLQVGTSASNIASYYIDDIILIDLTETFGSGNEPTKEWCDQNISWFEGNKNIYK